MGLVRAGAALSELTIRGYKQAPEFVQNRYPCLAYGVGLSDEYPVVFYREDFPVNGYDGELKANSVPSVESYRGFIFASLSEDAPDLKTWLGPTATSIDNMVDRSPVGKLEVTGGALRYNHDSNWKFFVENLKSNGWWIENDQGGGVFASKETRTATVMIDDSRDTTRIDLMVIGN